MSYSSLTEADVWPRLLEAIADERDRRIQGLLVVTSLEVMRHEQGFIGALDWIVDQARPPAVHRAPYDNDEDEN